MVMGLFRYFDIGREQGFRIGIVAALLFFLIAANNLLKILRDSIFLGHHPVSELPYLYILVAGCAAVVIAAYTKYTAHLSLAKVMLATNASVVAAAGSFWALLTYLDPLWSHYAFYVWSAMTSVIAVAQAWTLANHVFTHAEARRSFGLLAAGGTIGGVVASFGAKWSLDRSLESIDLLWAVAGIYVLGAALVFWAEARLGADKIEGGVSNTDPEAPYQAGITGLVSGSLHLKTIALVIFISVIVSTMIDFHFKISAKQSYPSAAALAGFFSSYYGWLNTMTFVVQVLLTGKLIRNFGLAPSLYLTPGTLLTGSVAIILWPGLPAAMITRMADAILRNSIHRSGMEIMYMSVPSSVVKAVKTFLDVVVERVGDASAGFIILIFSIFWTERYIRYVHLICVGLIVSWLFLNRFLRSGYSEVSDKRAELEEASRRRTWLESDES